MTRHETMRQCFDRRRALLAGLAKIDGQLARLERMKNAASWLIRVRLPYLQGRRRWHVRELADVALRYVDLAQRADQSSCG